MRQLGLLSLILCLATASGCNLCCWGKRNSELTGPTDIRKSQQWCLGEDAIFHQPMGPGRADYGMKQTIWREWNSDGPACANGSCGAVTTPTEIHHQPEAVPQLVPPQRSKDDSGVNPFRDDAVEPLPAPGDSGGASTTKKKSASQRMRMAATAKPSEFQTIFTGPTQSVPRTAKPASQKPVTPKLPPRVVTIPASASSSRQIAQQPTSKSSSPDPNRLRITVSDAIDIPPAKTMAPIVAHGTVIPAALPSPEDQVRSQETAASLERLMEVSPATNATSGTGPAVIRNEYAVPAKPFRLSTRTSRPESNRDPELERQTLSALGDMFSEDGAESGGE